MASVCAPGTVVTAMVDGTPHGATVSSFASLSLRPPLVSIALDRRSTLLGRILRTHRFGVNVLGAGNEDIALTFAASQTDKFCDMEWRTDHCVPQLTCAVSWVVCELHDVVSGGDHLLLLGRVTHAASTGAASLVYGNRRFGAHPELDISQPAIDDLIAAFAVDQ
ncbi:flavin reductase family protein [Actinopolyspora lacussalsi]|nr:flavin reductase family protein [Actinopolyspora righensis]